MSDLIERLNARARNTPSDVSRLLSQASDRIAALEAEASKGERLRALLADIHRTSPKPYRLDRPGLTHGQAAEIGYGALRDAIQARVVVALIPEAPAREGWQPIETAPRDGREVLITDGDAVGAGFYDDAPMAHRADAGWFWEDDRANLLTAKNAGATHWMPLPAPPQDNREG